MLLAIVAVIVDCAQGGRRSGAGGRKPLGLALTTTESLSRLLGAIAQRAFQHKPLIRGVYAGAVHSATVCVRGWPSGGRAPWTA